MTEKKPEKPENKTANQENKHPKQITLECIFCDVPLHFNEEKGFWRCPDCGGEWWPGPSDPYYGITTLWRDEQAYKKSISKPGGGSRTKSKKNRKGSTKTPQPWLHET